MTTTFIGDGATLLWSDAGNWDNGIPSPSNDAILDGVSASGDKNSTIDIAALGAVSLVGYLGTVISNIVTITVNGNFLHNTGTFLSISLNLDIIGSFIVAANAPDFQLPSASNMSVTGDVLIGDDSCVLENTNTFFTVGVGGSTFDISNPDNNNRINDLRLTAGCTMNMLITLYADTITGPTSGTSTITGDGEIINLDAWLNGNNINCVADVDGGVKITSSYTPIPVFNYGNFTISSTLDTVTIAGFGPNNLTCFNIFVFKSIQNTTVNMTAIGNFSAIINGTLKISDDVIDTRGGIFEWTSVGNLTMGNLQLSDINGIQEAKIIISTGSTSINILNDFTVGSLAEVDSVVLSNNIIPVGGDIIIDAVAVTDFGLSTIALTGTGVVSNPTLSNSFFILSMAAAGQTTTLIDILRGPTNSLILGAGSFDLVTFLIDLEMDTLIIDPACIILGTGTFAFSPVSAITIPAHDYGGTTLQASNNTLNLSGNTQSDVLTSATGSSQVNCGAGSNTFNRIIVNSLSSIDFQSSTTEIKTTKFEPAGNVDFGTSIIILQAGIDLTITASFTGSPALVFSGDTPQDVTLVGLIPSDVFIKRSGDTVSFLDAWTCSGTITEIALGNNTVQWLNAGAYSCDHIQTVGEGNFKTSNISSGAGNYQITVAEIGVVNRFSGWANCDIIGAFIEVDLLTGSDDGGNDVTPPFGIDFGNFPLDPINFQGFGKLRKLGPAVIFPNIYRAPHKWHAAAVPIAFFLVKNAIGEQVLNAISENVIT